jgi:uncharacterized secreted protein with C-terminal beta-propeller domain
MLQVRYAEEMAYVVTFRQVDPLFVLDLSGASIEHTSAYVSIRQHTSAYALMAP